MCHIQKHQYSIRWTLYALFCTMTAAAAAKLWGQYWSFTVDECHGSEGGHLDVYIFPSAHAQQMLAKHFRKTHPCQLMIWRMKTSSFPVLIWLRHHIMAIYSSNWYQHWRSPRSNVEVAIENRVTTRSRNRVIIHDTMKDCESWNWAHRHITNYSCTITKWHGLVTTAMKSSLKCKHSCQK